MTRGGLKNRKAPAGRPDICALDSARLPADPIGIVAESSLGLALATRRWAGAMSAIGSSAMIALQKLTDRAREQVGGGWVSVKLTSIAVRSHPGTFENLGP